MAASVIDMTKQKPQPATIIKFDPTSVVQLPDTVEQMLEECPRWLSPEAKIHWAEVIPMLHKMGMIAVTDRDVLAAYCSILAQFKKADTELMMQEGFTQKTQSGYSQVSAEYVVWRDLSDRALKYARQLGLTPTARQQMKIGAGKPTDDIDDL